MLIRVFSAFAFVVLFAACSPSASQPYTYNMAGGGGIRVDGPATYSDLAAAQTPAEACASLGAEAFPPGYCDEIQNSDRGDAAACEGDAAFELFTSPDWLIPGNPWVSRCR